MKELPLMPSMMLSGYLILMESVSIYHRRDGNFDNGWLNDMIKDASHAVLRQQFPHEQGMQSMFYAANPSFSRSLKDLLKVINTHPNDGLFL